MDTKKKGVVKRTKFDDIWDSAEASLDNAVQKTLIPQAKAMLFNFITDGVRQIIFGPGSTQGLNKTHYNYNNISTTWNGSSKTSNTGIPLVAGQNTPAPRWNTAYKKFAFDTAIQAYEVLDELKSDISTLQCAGLDRFYELVGIPVDDYECGNYGWKNLDKAVVQHLFDGGYQLVLPTVERLR